MPSLRSSPSATRVLAQRERGLGDGPIRRNVERLTHSVLRRLALSPDRQFFSTSSASPAEPPIVCQGALIYVDGKIYLRNNATKSYDCLSVYDLSKKFYSLPMRPKWLDQVSDPCTHYFQGDTKKVHNYMRRIHTPGDLDLPLGWRGLLSTRGEPAATRAHRAQGRQHSPRV